MRIDVFLFWMGVMGALCAYWMAFNGMILWAGMLGLVCLWAVLAGDPGDWGRKVEPPKAVVSPPRWPGPEKYVLHPGPVVSQTDGQTHHISAHQLARLYGVRPVDCVVVFPNSPRLGDLRLRDLIHLYPRYDGDYRLPEAS